MCGGVVFILMEFDLVVSSFWVDTGLFVDKICASRQDVCMVFVKD